MRAMFLQEEMVFLADDDDVHPAVPGDHVAILSMRHRVRNAGDVLAELGRGYEELSHVADCA
jgi:hypothetical protein